jgi:hypothetical protein
MMDGVYITSPRQGPLRYLLSAVLRRLAETFLVEKTPWFKFMVRGCISFGPLIDGRDLPEQASHSLARNPTYRDSILIGIPLAQAYRGETSAPPFGVFIDESARRRSRFHLSGGTGTAMQTRPSTRLQCTRR